MVFNGISKVFSTKDNEQYKTIVAFWDEMSQLYGMENIRGLGYNWTEDSIEYVIGLKNGVIDNVNCDVELPNDGWSIVIGDTNKLPLIYKKIYEGGPLKYEIEMFFENDKCEIWYYR